MASKSNFHFLYLVIFILSAALRVGIALVNRQANDSHLNVTRIIMQENRLPEYDDCVECSHPKFFHYVIAEAARGVGIQAADTAALYVFTQMINAGLGIIIILTLWKLLTSLPAAEPVKVIAFALTAFNPKLIGINAQATNDTFAIFFSTLAIYFAYRALQTESKWALLASTALASLGVATKENVLPIAGGIFAAFLIKAYKDKRRVSIVFAAFFFAGLAVFSLLNPLTQYAANYQKHGNVIVMNEAYLTLPLPSFSQKTYYLRPGIVSIQDGLLTFKYANLLAYPRLKNEKNDYPAHRTSLWTQLYARAHSVHFDNWPSSWSSQGEDYFTLTRIIFVFALVPTALLLTGVLLQLKNFFINLLPSQPPSAFDEMGYGIFIINFFSSLVFIALFATLYRDFSTMKVIFIYPAVLTYPILFLEAARLFQNKKWFVGILSLITAALVALYSIDLIAMALHLRALL